MSAGPFCVLLYTYLHVGIFRFCLLFKVRSMSGWIPTTGRRDDAMRQFSGGSYRDVFPGEFRGG